MQRFRSDPATADVPIVVLSEDASRQQIEQLRAAGAQAYLTKPLDVQQLLVTIDEVLSPRET